MLFSRARLAQFVASVLAVVVGLFVVACSTPPAIPPREPTPGTFHFKISTFNVHMDKANDGETYKAIGGDDADIVCLQEVTGEWERVIRENYTGRYPYILTAPKENAGGLAILSRFPLEDLGVIPVPGDLHPAWHVLAQTPYGKIQVFNVHLRSMFNGDSNPISNYFSKDEDHMMEIELFMSKALPNMPTVILGDYNESPKGDVVSWLQGQGYRNALRLFKPKQNTWRGKFLIKVLKMTIDHVMFDPQFEPLDSWVGWRGNSDHYPVIAHLEVPAWRSTTTTAPAVKPSPFTQKTTREPLDEEKNVLDLDDPDLDPKDIEDGGTITDPPR